MIWAESVKAFTRSSGRASVLVRIFSSRARARSHLPCFEKASMSRSSAVPRRLSLSKKSSVPLGNLSRKAVSSVSARGQSLMKNWQIALRKETTALSFGSTSTALVSSSSKRAKESLYFFSSRAFSADLKSTERGSSFTAAAAGLAAWACRRPVSGVTARRTASSAALASL